MISLVGRALSSALVALALVPAAAAAQRPHGDKPPFDSRTDERVRPEAPESAGAIRARDRLSARLGRQGVFDVDPRTGTPRFVGRLDGWLTGPSGADPEQIVLDYVRTQRAVFGDPEGLRLVRRYESGGTTFLAWAQTWRGITVFDNGLQAAVAADGRLINVSGSPLPDVSARSSDPQLSAGEALAKVLDGGLPPREESQTGPDRRTEFTGGHDARLVLFADRAGDVHLAWRVTANAGPAEVYDAVVDAQSGDLLFRRNEVDFVGGTVHAFSFHPGAGTQDPRAVEVVDNTRLFGPNAHVFADLNDDGFSAGEDIPASSNPPPTWNYPADSKERSGSHLYYFVNEFHDWLKLPPFDFTAASGAFENGDRLLARTRDGAGLPSGPRDNAFMSTPPDGQSPTMAMFLWTATSPPRDSSEDASVVFHEYTHGLSNRLITDSAGEGALNSPQAAAMGEGWSDWYAFDYLADPAKGNLAGDTPTDGQLAVGEYVNGGSGIRSEPLDCPRDSSVGDCNAGGTYGDFGQVANFSVEHRNGEVWAQTLWDLRTAVTPAVARRIITDGMRLSPADPSMLEARNAILIADQNAFGGSHRSAIWQVFADRGMGFFAVSYGGYDVSPREDSSVPGATTTVSGRVTDALTGAPVASALVTLASSASGMPGDVTAVSDANGNYSMPGVVPGTYPRPLVDAPGYSPGLAPDVNVPSGGRTLDAQLVRSWASAEGGATRIAFDGPDYTAFGCGPGGAIDLDYGTGWGSTSQNAPTPPGSPGAKSITIALPQPVDVSAFNIDPAATCGDDSTASTGQYRIDTSRDGTTFSEAANGQFTGANNHRMNVIAAPAGTTGVRFVRYTMLRPQRQVNRVGTEDDDAGRAFMDTTEFEVYGVPEGFGKTTAAVPPVTGDSGFVAVDGIAPRLGLALVARQRLRTALGRGLKVTLECDEACSARFTARLGARTAKRVGLLPRASRANSVIVATGSRPLGGGRRTATLRFTAAAKRRLAGVRSVKLSIAATARDASANTAARTVKVTVRR